MIKQTRAFRNNYPAAILLTILLLFSAASQAQLRDSKYYTPITPAYSWMDGWFKRALAMPDSIAPFGIGRGNFHFDTTTKSIRVYDGLTWIYQRGVDSIWIVDGGSDPDTLRYRSLGTTYIAGTITGGGGGSSYTFANGLTESAGTVKLGGALTEGTHIWNNTFKYSYALSGTDSVVAQTNNTGFRVDRYKTGVANNLIVGEDMYFEVNNGSTQSAGLQFFNSFGSMATYFQDSRTVKTGLQYSSLDTTGWATSTLVTKDYINKRLSNRLTYNLINGGANIAGSGVGIFKDTSSNKLNFKRLKAGWNTKVTDGTDSVVISVDTTTQTLTDGATITFDANAGVSARVTITATRTLAFSNFRNGMFLTLLVIQDGTGGWGLNLPASARVINGGAGAVTLTTAASSHDILTFWKINDIVYCNYGKNYN